MSTVLGPAKMMFLAVSTPSYDSLEKTYSSEADHQHPHLDELAHGFHAKCADLARVQVRVDLLLFFCHSFLKRSSDFY